MKYGFFDNDAKEYVIERPDTPLPWINYLGKENFYSLISNTAGGYCFMVDARKKRLTRYRYNNVPMDTGGRYLYFRDDDTGNVWSPTWMPVKAELDSYECRHGFGYTKLKSQKNGVEVNIRYFVPLGADLEVWEVTVTNTSSKAKNLKAFSFVEWCLWEALNDMTNYQSTYNYGEVEVDGNVIYHKTEYRERRSHFAYFACSEDVAGFDTDGLTFFGTYGGFEGPAVVLSGKPSNSVAEGWNPIGSHCCQLSLKPGEKKQINFVLGYWENPENKKFSAKHIIDKSLVMPVINEHLDRTNTSRKFDELAENWKQTLGVLQVDTPDSDVNTMINMWTQYQCVMTYIHARSTSYWETGIGRGIGYRDACQDIYGAVHLMPRQRIRQRILDLAGIQWRNGACYHQFQPLTKRGNADIGVGFNDDPLWLILATATYIKETGDRSILDEQACFDNNPDDAASLYEHLKISFEYIQKYRGPHGLPLIGRADWNDCLNLLITRIEAGENWQGEATYAALDSKLGKIPESLMISGQFVMAIGELARIAEARSDTETANKARSAVKQMTDNIIKHGWDGQWFVRAYDRYGKKIGSAECEEGKIFIESQVWNVWAGVGLDNGYARRAMDSVREHLYCEHGIMINHPAYTVYNQDHGQMTTVPPGLKENGSIFCQPNGWAVIAECMLGRGDKALEYYKTICPINREKISEVHCCEPYVYAQMIASPDSVYCGQARNSWLTGTAAANLLAISQYMLGVRPDYDGLKITPSLPSLWKGCKVTRRFRGDTYIIEIVNPDGLSSGDVDIELDGSQITGDIIPVCGDGKTHNARVVIRAAEN